MFDNLVTLIGMNPPEKQMCNQLERLMELILIKTCLNLTNTRTRLKKHILLIEHSYYLFLVSSNSETLQFIIKKHPQ